MHLVAEIDDIRFLRAALQHGGNPDARDNVTDETPLFLTILYGREGHTALLFKAGADINARPKIPGLTLPMLAVASSANYKLVCELLQKGADYSLKGINGKTLADAIELRAIPPNDDQYIWREKVMEFLRSKGVQVHRPAHERPRTKPIK